MIVTSEGVRPHEGGYRLGPGDYCAVSEPVVLSTVLGSCVSACIFEHRSGIGGMNHFLLPRGRPTDPGRSTRYGVYAMELLINELLKLGARRDRLVAKGFGGARLLGNVSDIGGVNSRFLREYLELERIPLVAADLGGEAPRHVRFAPETGLVRLKVLREPSTQVASRESRHLEQLSKTSLEGEVELF